MTTSSARSANKDDAPLVAGFSTDDVEPREQFASWREQMGPRFGIADVSRVETGPFKAKIETFSIGRLALSDVAAAPMTFERTRRHVESRDRDEFTIGVLVSGDAVVEQDGRQATLGAGDLVVCDARRPYRLRFDTSFRQLVFHCDRAQLEARVPDVEQRTARRVAGQGAVPAKAAEYLASVARNARHVGAAECVIAQHGLDLLALALVGSGAVPTSGVMLARVQAFIEENLSDPDLCPASIARRHGISRRHLYRLFDEGGDSVAAFVRRRRLSRCRAELADERMSARGISEIAFAWGFNDATSFGRAFRDAFGVTPREYRRASSAKRWVP